MLVSLDFAVRLYHTATKSAQVCVTKNESRKIEVSV